MAIYSLATVNDLAGLVDVVSARAEFCGWEWKKLGGRLFLSLNIARRRRIFLHPRSNYVNTRFIAEQRMTGSNSSGSTHDGVPDCRDEGFPNELATLKTILGHVDDFLAHFDDSVFIIETKEEIYKNAEGIVACGRNALTVAHQLCVGFRYLPELPEKSAALRNRIIDNALRIEDEIYRILEVRNLELLPAADKSEVACAQRLVACADHVKVCPFLASIKKDRQLLLARCHEIVSANRTAADFACNQSSN